MSEVRLIDANALKKEFIKEFYMALGQGADSFDVIGTMTKVIDNTPTVEPDKIQAIMSDYLVCRCEPQRPQGEWIIDGHHIRCNRCNEYICNTDREGNKIPNNFCPNCGADMRGEDTNETS